MTLVAFRVLRCVGHTVFIIDAVHLTHPASSSRAEDDDPDGWPMS